MDEERDPAHMNEEQLREWTVSLGQELAVVEEEKSALQAENAFLRDSNGKLDREVTEAIEEVSTLKTQNEELKAKVEETKRQLGVRATVPTTTGKGLRTLQRHMEKSFPSVDEVRKGSDPASLEFECSKCTEPEIADATGLPALKGMSPISMFDRARIYAIVKSDVPLTQKLSASWSGSMPNGIEIDSQALTRAAEDALHCRHRAIRFGMLATEGKIKHYAMAESANDPSQVIRNVLKLVNGKELATDKVNVVAPATYSTLFSNQATITYSPANNIEEILFKLKDLVQVDNLVLVIPVLENIDGKELEEIGSWINENAENATVLAGMVRDIPEDFQSMGKSIATIRGAAPLFSVVRPSDVVGTKSLASLAFLPRSGPPSLPFLLKWYEGCRQLVGGLPVVVHSHHKPYRGGQGIPEKVQPKQRDTPQFYPREKPYYVGTKRPRFK